MTRRLLRDESGIALVYVLLVMMVMSSIAFVTLVSIEHEQKSSYTQTQRQTAYQAAEAGIDDYMAKLKDDPQYYLHWIHPAESVRRSSGGVTVPVAYDGSGNPIQQAWAYTNVWTYPSGKSFVRKASSSTVPSGYEYNIQVTPPTLADPTLKIVSTGRKAGDTNTKDYRVVQQVLTPNSITRFYRIVNGNIGFGSTTTTQGMVWSNGNITHDGIAQANLYATGSITGSVTMQNGATKNASQSPPINFSSFLASLTDISRAASVNSPSTYFDDPTRDAWKLVFNTNGTYTAQACDKNSGNAVAKVLPTTNCTSVQTYTVPTNGAIYTPQDVIVSGTVTGRVTVASSSNIILGGALNPTTPGTDVIGLDAQVDLIIAAYTPSTLSWNASVLAQTGTWHTYESGTNSHSSMTFAGSSTTDDGGDMTMFASRTYGYDNNLVFLQPPWFPSLVKPWTTTLFRELPPS
jgi:Tfp pilus assembly protein PilX